MEEAREQSEFNMALFTLGRINYSLFLCSEHFRNMELSAAFLEMINTYMEISTEMKGDFMALITGKPLEEQEDEYKIMENFIIELEPLVEKFNSKNIDKKKLNKNLYIKLRLMNMLLRKIMKDAGLLLKVKEDARFALGR